MFAYFFILFFAINKKYKDMGSDISMMDTLTLLDKAKQDSAKIQLILKVVHDLNEILHS